jgi:hypothetical protein
MPGCFVVSNWSDGHLVNPPFVIIEKSPQNSNSQADRFNNHNQ